MSTQKSQFGRSLIEMILVLALISLLAIGGIVGYKALATRTESRTVAETITRHVIQRRHEAMTKKGLQENLKVNIEGPHGVSFDISNDVGNHLIIVTTKGKNSDLIKSLAKSDVLKSEAYSIDEPVITDDESSVVMKFLQYRNSETENVVEPEPGTEPSEPVTQTCTTHSDCPTGYLCASGTCTECTEGNTCGSCPDETPYWDNGKCVCQGTSCGEESYCDADGECQDCPDNANCSSGSVQCNEGYEGNVCSECVTDGSKTCGTCASTTPYWDGEDCVSAICPPNSSTTETDEQIGTTGCYCNTGYIVNAAGDGCVAEQSCTPENDTCGEGYYCNPITNKCAVNTCTVENATPNPIENNQITGTECYCKEGYILNSEKTGCVEDVCGGNACCQEMIAAGFELDTNCTAKTCVVTKDKTIQKENTFFMSNDSTSFYKGVMTFNNDIELKSCNTLFVKGDLNVHGNMTAKSINVTGTLTLNSDKNLTANDITVSSVIINDNAKLYVTGSALLLHTSNGSVWEETPNEPKIINRGLIDISEGLQANGSTLENYGRMTSEDTCEATTIFNYGYLKATTLYGRNTENSGELDLSGALELRSCYAGTCEGDLENSGTINATSMSCKSLKQTTGNISISGDAILGASDANIAIDISGGKVTIGGIIDFSDSKKGIKLSNSGNLTVNSASDDSLGFAFDKGLHTTEGPAIEVLNGGELILNAGRLGSITTDSDIGIKITGSNSKIKVKGDIGVRSKQHAIWQTGGEIIACGHQGYGVEADSPGGIYITGGMIKSQNRVRSCLRPSTNSLCINDISYWEEFDEEDPDSEYYNSHIMPYTDIPWCNE